MILVLFFRDKLTPGGVLRVIVGYWNHKVSGTNHEVTPSQPTFQLRNDKATLLA